MTRARWDEELLAAPELSAGAAARRLREGLQAHGFELLAGATTRARRIFLDSFDGRLQAAGLAAVHLRRDGAETVGRLAVVKREGGAEVAGEDRFPAPGGPILALDLAVGPVREALLPVIDVRALLPLAELDGELTEYAVLDDERKTVTRLTIEQAGLVAGVAPGPLLRVRLRLQEVRGYRSDRQRVSACARELGFVVPRHRLLDEAVLAAGGNPGGTSAKVAVELIPSQRSDAAAAAVLRALAEVVEDNLEGAIADLDVEFLHDLRVAVRRGRSVQKELRGVFAPDALAHFRREFKWVQQVTGRSRDLDVYVLEFGEMRALVPEPIQADLDLVVRVLGEQRAAARRAMARELGSPRMAALRRDWDACLEELVALPVADRPDAEVAVAELAGRRIAKVYQRMRKMGEAIDGHSPSEDYHEIRKQGKELRYLLELFGAPLFPAAAVKPMVKALKRLQDVLGRHQDREVQRRTLRELAEPVSAQPGRAEALMAMGVLAERLYEDELAARDEFAERFAEFTAQPLREQVKATFR